MALLILIVGPLAALRTPVDIFPEIRIPVIAVVWQYTGLPPDQMSGRVMLNFQRALTTTVNDIEHIEGTSYTGVGIVKIFFQPGVDISIANAQVTAIAQTVLRQMPPNITPPLILNYNAATVPIIQLALAGKGVPEQGVRPRHQHRPHAAGDRPRERPSRSRSAASSGRSRSISRSRGPAGAGPVGGRRGQCAGRAEPPDAGWHQKIGGHEYAIQLNNAPADFNALADIPVFAANGTVVYLRDVAQVRDGNPPQQNIVHVDGGRSVLLAVLKNGTTSTLAIIAGIKERVAELKKVLPANVSLAVLGDQSLFVEGAVSGVAHEAVLAAVLTSLMILLFLGSWRSTVIIAISIPLAILGSIALLAAFGETLNIMTWAGWLCGRHPGRRCHGDHRKHQLASGAGQGRRDRDHGRRPPDRDAAFVSLLCICIVFVPMFFLEGVARFLFVPMAMAVIFAMVCSFILSRTLVPTMANFLLKPHGAHSHGEAPPPSRNPLVRFQRGFEARFERLRAVYHDLLGLALARRGVFIVCFMAFVLGSFALVPFLGPQFLSHRRFRPDPDACARTHRHPRRGDRQQLRGHPEGDPHHHSAQPDRHDGRQCRHAGQRHQHGLQQHRHDRTAGRRHQIKLTPDHRPTEEYVAALRERLPELFPASPSPSCRPTSSARSSTSAPRRRSTSRSAHRTPMPASSTPTGCWHVSARSPESSTPRIQQSRGAPVFAVDIDRCVPRPSVSRHAT